MSDALDAIDSKAVTLLAGDARLSWAELAEALGLSAPAAAERVRRLEERGVIQGYEARIDARSIGVGLTAFVAVTLARRKDREDLLKRVASEPSILECHHTAGEDDYFLKLRCRDTADLERVLTETLRAHDGILRTKTTVVLSTTKETLKPPLPRSAPARRKGKSK